MINADSVRNAVCVGSGKDYLTPMKSNIHPIQPDTFYHIYNRGINGETIFKELENYPYFLNKYKGYISKVADTPAYCLLKNHFHFLIRTKSDDQIQTAFSSKGKTSSTLISLQFSHLFNGYTQAINKSTSRTGSLFETPFRRMEVREEHYLRRLLFYIHFNSQKQGLCNDFRQYTFSSYQAFVSNKPTELQKSEVINLFGNEQAFTAFHLDLNNLDDIPE